MNIPRAAGWSISSAFGSASSASPPKPSNGSSLISSASASETTAYGTCAWRAVTCLSRRQLQARAGHMHAYRIRDRALAPTENDQPATRPRVVDDHCHLTPQTQFC